MNERSLGMGEKEGESKIGLNNSDEGNDTEDEDDDEFNPNWHHYCGYCEVEDGPTTKHFD